MTKITEAQIGPADVKAIFKNAYDARNKSSGPGKIFKFLQKEKISLQDLQKSWKEAGYPDDIRDIEEILKSYGFSKKEINGVFSKVFGQDKSGEYEDPTGFPVVEKIAKYIIQVGVKDEIIQFMKKEYNMNESAYNGKVMVEDIREIFSYMVNEERTDLPVLIQKFQKDNLGRVKKS